MESNKQQLNKTWLTYFWYGIGCSALSGFCFFIYVVLTVYKHPLFASLIIIGVIFALLPWMNIVFAIGIFMINYFFNKLIQSTNIQSYFDNSD